MEKEKFFMREALRLAEKGRGKASPNPMVGAVVVKGDKIIGEGFHKQAGGPHAEIFAIRKAGKRAAGAILYVNLEPCAHFGRTPPCTDAIIKSGIKKVILATKDPNPLNNGKGIRILRKGGVKVKVGVLKKEAKSLNKAFIKYITKKLPFVTIKVAQSLDGKIATPSGDSKWITGEPARNFVHRLRRDFDAILVGVNTIIKDDPLLFARPYRHFPIKVILDPELKTPLNARIFSKDSPGLVIIVTLNQLMRLNKWRVKAKALTRRGGLVISERKKNGKIDLKSLLRRLAGLEVVNLLVEGGGTTIANFIESRLADQALFFIAPKIIGGRDAITSVEGKGIEKVTNALQLKNIKVGNFGRDILISGELK